MKAKKLWAVALSVAMVLTSFTVPTFAGEVVEPVEEVIVEEVSEDASVVEEEPAYEVTLEEVTEEVADSAIETGTSIMAEGQEGDTYYVLNKEDIAKYLGNASNTSKTRGKYILAPKNAGKDVYLKLAQDVTIDPDTIAAIPGDRQLHIDLNGHTLDASAATTIELKEMTGDFKGWQSLYIENSAALGHFGNNITITVKGTEGTPIKQSLLNVGTGVCSDANVTVDGGIISYDKNSTIELGKTVNVLSGLANISADVEGTLTGKNIALSNASINAGATVTLNDGSSITGSNACNAVIETIGNVTINDDGKSLELNVTAGTATMTGGEIKAVEVNGATAEFVMNGGRIDSPTTAVNVVSGTATLNAGIVHGNSRAVSGTFNGTTSTKKYIIDGVEADGEEIRRSGDIKDADDLEYAFTHGGDWVLADDVTESNALTLDADLTLTNKSGYVINMGGNDITVGAHKLTLDVNIFNGQINASAAGAKLIILGGKYVAPTGSDNNMITTDDLANKVEIRGGVIAGSEGADYVLHGGKLPDASDCSAANCAINDGAGNYNNAAVVKNGKEVVEFSQETAKAYILLNSATTVNISDVLGGLGAKGITATGLATVDAAFRSSHNGTSSNVTGLTYNSLSGDINLAAATEGTDVLDATIYYTFYGDSPADAVEVASATVKIDCTTKSDSDIAKLADEYNATLEFTSGKMNAYAREFKIYFDFHRVGNEGKLIAAAEPSKLEPTAAVINVKKGSTFSKYFENTNDLYPVKYDSEKDMYYVELKPETEGSSTYMTTKLAMDEVKKFPNLSINVGFEDPSAPGTLLFSVPMTKYAYNAVIPASGNVDQEYALGIEQTEPMLTFENVESDSGKAITINPAYDNNKSYWIDFTEMPEVEDSKLEVHPGYFKGQDIIDASDDNIDVSKLYMQSKSGKFNSNGNEYDANVGDNLEIYYMGSASDEEEEASEGEETTVKVMAEYTDYIGTHPLEVPVNTMVAAPKAKLNVSSFTVAKNEAISNIPLEFSSKNPDDLGAISYIEVVKNAKMFSVVQPATTPVIKTTNGKKFTYDGFKLAVQKISDKKGITGTIKVHYNGIKDKNGAEYVTTYTVSAKPVEPGKFRLGVKSYDTLYIGTASYSEAKISLKTNPDYANGSVSIEDVEIKSKDNIDYYGTGKISVSLNGMDLVVRKNIATKIPKDISSIKIKVNYRNANGEPMCTDSKGVQKDQTISVKINKNESVAPTKTSVDVIMNACTLSQKLYYNNTIEADNTAKRLTKNVSFGGKNYVLDSVTGTGDGAEKLFTVVDAGNGKVKITPKLDALKSGLITVGDNFAITLNLVEAGTGNGNTAHVNVNIKIEKDPTKFKVNAKINTKNIKLSSAAAYSSAKFTIKTVKPFYGMKIKSVEIDTLDKAYKPDRDYFEIQSINGGQGYTASDLKGGTDYSDFKVVFKNGKVPTKVSGSGVKSLITGGQKVPIVVKYENGLEAHLTLSVNITK